MKYKELLKSPKWQKKRLEILNRDNFTCTICKDTETQLHVHHESYFGKPWEVDSDKLKTVCSHCHAIIHFRNNDSSKIKKIKKYITPVENVNVSFYYIRTDKAILSYLIDHDNNNLVTENGIILKFFADDITQFAKL